MLLLCSPPSICLLATIRPFEVCQRDADSTHLALLDLQKAPNF